MVDLDSLVNAKKELQWLPYGHGFSGSSVQGIIMVSFRLKIVWFVLARNCNDFVEATDPCRPESQTLIRNRAKSASGAPRAKNVPRCSKLIIFAKGVFQLFNFQTIAMNPMWELSDSPIQYPIYL